MCDPGVGGSGVETTEGNYEESHVGPTGMDSRRGKFWGQQILRCTPSVHKNMQFSLFEKSNSLNFDQIYIKKY
jgi:hypothetical protein